MKKNLVLRILCVLLLSLTCAFFASCDQGTGKELKDVIAEALEAKELSVDGDVISGKVSNATDTFSFEEEFALPDEISYTVSTDAEGQEVVADKTVPLEIGDNTFYVSFQKGKEQESYTVTIYRKMIFTVTFVGGKTVIPDQYVEEGDFAVLPDELPEKDGGYNFLSWDFDFSTPITEDVTVFPKWENVPNLGIIFILDCSGSMGANVEGSEKTYLEMEIDAVKSALSLLSENDYCGIMTLSDTYTEACKVVPVSTGLEQLSAALDNITVSGGSTVFSPAIELAGQALRNIPDLQGRHVVLLTDGLPADLDDCTELVERNFQNGIKLSVVGVNMGDEAARDMSQLAESGGGIMSNKTGEKGIEEAVKDTISVAYLEIKEKEETDEE